MAPILRELLLSRLRGEGRTFMEEKLAAQSRSIEEIQRVFTACGRRAGKAPVELSPHEVDGLHAYGVTWPIRGWALDELCRAVWLVDSERFVDELTWPRVVARCFEEGEIRERQAVLRALPLLSGPHAHVPLAVSACRTHVVPIFEAIACDNPYPARYFPDLHFNQMALKAAFLELSLARIIGIEERRSRELDRMVRDYKAEREAAGRPVAADLRLLMMVDA
jgi:hypothetical protein